MTQQTKPHKMGKRAENQFLYLQEINRLASALNIALTELREVSENRALNCFDSVVTRLSPEVRKHVKVDLSPLYWPSNDYQPENR